MTSWGYPTTEEKGNPFVKEMAEAIANRGVRVVMIVVTFHGLRSIFSRRKTKWAKSELITLEEVRIYNFFPSFFRLKQLQRRLALWQMNHKLNSLTTKFGKSIFFQFHYILHASCWLFQDFLVKNNIPYTLFEHSPGSAFKGGVEKDYGGFRNFEDLKLFVRKASLRLARIKKYELKLTELYLSLIHI